jgi:predicted RNase H-like HicB family nuclease
MSKKLAYPVVITPAKAGGYSVYIPDFDRNTQGEDIADAIMMAQDAIETLGVYWQDTGKDVPAPSELSAVKSKAKDIATLVPVDFDEYRRKVGKQPVKKTLTIPSWLNVKAEEAGINFSATLQDALKARLGV